MTLLPYLLGGSVALGVIGLIYHKGRVHERAVQARIIQKVNAKVLTWEKRLSAEDEREMARLNAAVALATSDFAKTKSPIACLMTDSAADNIQSILGSEK